MNKTDFIAGVAEKAGLTKEQARKAVDAFAAVVAEELQKGEKVSLLGFGTFSVQDKPAREGINPATKAKIKIPARKAVKFKAGAALDLNAEVSSRCDAPRSVARSHIVTASSASLETAELAVLLR